MIDLYLNTIGEYLMNFRLLRPPQRPSKIVVVCVVLTQLEIGVGVNWRLFPNY